MSDTDWDVEQYAPCGGCGHQQRNCTCHKIQFHIPPKVPQCKVCGRVRIGRNWVRDDDTQPDLVVWACPLCADNQRRAGIRAEKAWQRKLRKDARTPHPVREMTEDDWKDLA